MRITRMPDVSKAKLCIQVSTAFPRSTFMASISKFIAIRIFSRRSPLTTPLESQSAPADWVWNALDIARRAAMADDLAHVPSITRIANIFTEMIEQLQGTKRNRDDFYEITNEIGNLIEAIIRHARQHDSTSPGFMGVCDDFLSAISSMHSEMGQLFKAPAKHFAKSKAYQDVLSSYRFRLRRLRGDFQALTHSSSPSSPSTGFSPNARGVTIVGGTFTEIQGNQYIVNNHGTADSQVLDTHSLSAGRSDDLDVSDYRVFKYGDLEAITAPRRRNHEVQEFIIRLENQIKTARTYTGEGALQAFKNNVRTILGQKFRHPHIIQLFGVCLSGRVPTLVFHGDLRRVDDDKHLDMRETLIQRFRILREWQAACHYLMDNYDQFRNIPAHLLDGIYPEVHQSDCSWRLYLDYSASQRLQVSIERPGEMTHVPRIDNLNYFNPPALSTHDMEAIEHMLSYGFIPDKSRIDAKTCLLVIYHILIDWLRPPPRLRSDTTILVSPMRRARAARLTFDREFRFKWSGWLIKRVEPKVEMSRVTIENDSWTRLTIAPKVSPGNHEEDDAIVNIFSFFYPPLQYFEMWLAQAERIKAQIRSFCSGSCEDLFLVTGGGCSISFQSYFSPPPKLQESEAVFLFIQDLRVLDDAFEIAWFWTKDPKGLSRLSQADMFLLGLDEPHQSKVYVHGFQTKPTIWKELGVFHELFGFPAYSDSPDIPHFLNLPFASVQWDGDENGPRTPQDLSLRTRCTCYYYRDKLP